LIRARAIAARARYPSEPWNDHERIRSGFTAIWHTGRGDFAQAFLAARLRWKWFVF
jgi:hypothetical protein